MPSRNTTQAPQKPRPDAGASAERETAAEKRPQLPLPHDRDESTRNKGHETDPVIDQAHEDIEQGKVDTDLRGKAGEAFERRWEGRRDRQ